MLNTKKVTAHLKELINKNSEELEAISGNDKYFQSLGKNNLLVIDQTGDVTKKVKSFIISIREVEE